MGRPVGTGRALGALAAVTVASCMLAPGALAGVYSYEHHGSEYDDVDGQTLPPYDIFIYGEGLVRPNGYSGPPPEVNRVTVRSWTDQVRKLRLTDSAGVAPIATAPLEYPLTSRLCSRSNATTVDCHAAAGTAGKGLQQLVDVDLGMNDDRLRFYGDSRYAYVSGGPGNDTLIASDTVNSVTDGIELFGAGGADRLIGAPSGIDYLYSGAGPDVVLAGGAADDIYTNEGNDRVETRDGVADFVDCGEGFDTAQVDALDSVHGCERVIVG